MRVLLAVLIGLLSVASFVPAADPLASVSAAVHEECPLTAPDVVPRSLPGEQRAAPPQFEVCTDGIRPGSRMTSPNGCTFNFVFTDGSRLYIGTAGHCVSGAGQRVSAQNIGAFGTVVFDLDGSTADDFALILIDSDKESLVDPRMCSFAGPVGVQTGGVGIGQTVGEYGWGVATQFHHFTRTRIHSAFGGGTTITWNGVGSGGDSGAPILTAAGNAYGTHTFGLTPVAGVISEGGPHIQHILTKTRAAGFNVDVVTV